MLSHDMWLTQFSDELLQLRPSLSGKAAWAVGLQEYDERLDPAAAARAYHSRAPVKPSIRGAPLLGTKLNPAR
jgi:hypothetical protein